MVMVLWAGNSIVGRAVRFDVPPLTLAFIRWTGASLLLLPFAIGPLRRDWSAILAGWKPVLLLGALGVGAFNALLYSGLRETPATNALLLQAATPALVVAFDRIFFGVRSPLLQNLGVAASILGVAMIVFQGNLARAAALNFGGGDVLILGSVLVWSLYMVLLRWRPDISPISFVAATFFIGVLAMAPFAAWDWLSGNHIRWSVKVVGAFAYVAVLPSIVSYFIFNSAAHVLGPARAGQTITLMPIFGAFLSAALLGEDLHGYHFVGMALILSGIGLSILAMRQQTRAGPAVGSSLEERA
ncbi:EamA family transporter [Altererythrobacter xixiisoli]|uniref:EamA family transporter n=2 Tax=Croceibacterium xixiisoli TaxID=1476466 RepID=A0A6I4TPU4_9SPHN|nr:EamA family transporter [Croceibacterium xixiisoli]